MASHVSYRSFAELADFWHDESVPGAVNLDAARETRVMDIKPEMFGFISMGLGEEYSRVQEEALAHLGACHIRWPGGTLSETGIIDERGIVRQSGSGELFYDLAYDDLIADSQLTEGSWGLSKMLELARETTGSFQLILPTIRYVGDEDKCREDVRRFLEKLLVQQAFGELPDNLVIDIGNEGLAWKSQRDYAVVSAWILDEVGSFRDRNPALSDAFKISLQAGWSEEATKKLVSSYSTQLDETGLTEKELRGALAEVDVLRAHLLSKSYLDAERAEDYSRGAGDVAPLIEMLRDARHFMGDNRDVLLNISAWSVSSGSGREAPSLSAAASCIALFASMNELGASMSSAWGVRDTGPEAVNLTYVNSNGSIAFTHAAEAYRLMAESLVGTKLLDTGNYSKSDIEKEPYFVKAYADDIKVVFFVTAGRGGVQDVKIRLDDFGEIGKVFGTRLGTVDDNGRFGDLYDTPSVGDTTVSIQGNTLSFQTSQLHEVVRIVVYHEPQRAETGITGSRGSDNLILPRASVTTHAWSGNDTIISGGGRADVICGAGNDVFYGGEVTDTAYGGTGSDRIYGNSGADNLFGMKGNDTIHGGRGADYLSGGAGHDRIFADSNGENGKTGPHLPSAGDTIYGGAGRDLIYGSGSNDLVYGGTGDDRINSGAGQDKIFGGSGNDTISGGIGKDYLYGGHGHDIFVFRDEGDSLRRHVDRDTIVDFQGGIDLIDIRSISDDSESSLVVRAARAFSGVENEVIFFQTQDGNALICADFDGDYTTDFSIKVISSVIELSDFLY